MMYYVCTWCKHVLKIYIFINFAVQIFHIEICFTVCFRNLSLSSNCIEKIANLNGLSKHIFSFTSYKYILCICILECGNIPKVF